MRRRPSNKALAYYRAESIAIPGSPHRGATATYIPPIAIRTLTDAFYLLKTDVAVRPFIFQDRIPLEFTAQEQDSDEGFRRDKFLYGVRARYRMTYGYWQYALKITFTA